MKKTKWLYMHTIRGIPAQYIPDEQIVYANGTRGQAGVTRLAESVKQIKQEQRLSSSWRRKQNWDDAPGAYGYIRIAKAIF
jgi:hypothetical protein